MGIRDSTKRYTDGDGFTIIAYHPNGDSFPTSASEDLVETKKLPSTKSSSTSFNTEASSGNFSSSESTPKTSIPPSPHEKADIRRLFDFEDADIILRSNDRADFKVHRLVLGLASERLKCPKEENDYGPPTKRRKGDSGATCIHSPLPIISINESARFTEDLLCYIYAVRRPMDYDLRGLCSQIYLVDRWDLRTARTDLVERLCNSSLIAEDPVYAYDIGKRLNLPNVRRLALRALYNLPFEGDNKYFMDETLSLTAKDLQQIIGWKKRHFEDIKSLIDKYKCPAPPRASCKDCRASKAGKWCWWSDFKSSARQSVQPITDKILHSLILNAADDCEESLPERYDAITLILSDLRDRIASLPMEYQGEIVLSAPSYEIRRTTQTRLSGTSTKLGARQELKECR
ncbi:hypothetical protein SISSUDRAFT_1063955 [Sistotremastrum suecicum HHB10207 ss-3]|uniref:BTB domain-containing protein n=1 Tax=Sistotremastrum suecicum HHB10207 ss-3 TaxID=1314776 RepID=A0A166B8K7_9AGAM|nr:hypothetical protein SISSUDRAFT_1063955 [Sistotremastrum suecicum HHB10207 ss-3]